MGSLTMASWAPTRTASLYSMLAAVVWRSGVANCPVHSRQSGRIGLTSLCSPARVRMSSCIAALSTVATADACGRLTEAVIDTRRGSCRTHREEYCSRST
jgi:hypothetical protein